MAGESTPKRRPQLKEPWKPGMSGNPKGRPKGAGHRFGEMFWNDLSAEWKRRGIEALKVMEDAEFVRVAAAKAPTIIEADVDVRISGWLDVLRDEQ